MKFKIIYMLLFVWAVQVFAQEISNLENLKRELTSLKNLNQQKLDALEKAEANRWNKRYQQSAKSKQYEEHIRNLESQYARLASELNRKQEELLRAGGETRELNGNWEEVKTLSDAFRTEVVQSINKSAEELSKDIPLLLNERTLLLSDLSKKADNSNTPTSRLVEDFFNFRSMRLDLTVSQSLESRNSFIGEEEFGVWRLQLGTVFVGELSKSSEPKSQLLLRTGKLQGKVFAWRDKLTQGFDKKLQDMIHGVVDKEEKVNVVLDVNQNKGFGVGFTGEEEKDVKSSLLAWFGKGGLVMYPLGLVALFGLLLCLEKYFVLVRKSVNAEKLMKKIGPLIAEQKWFDAQNVCKRSKASLNLALASILEKADVSRDAAEKAYREKYLREIPFLEKRMTLIAAIGGSAPLMGLLGTVSGMISLFKVITDVGTNDPRILAGGISEALITTQTGLMIAIPILLIHGFLSDRLDKLQNDMSSQSLSVMNKIWPKGK